MLLSFIFLKGLKQFLHCPESGLLGHEKVFILYKIVRTSSLALEKLFQLFADANTPLISILPSVQFFSPSTPLISTPLIYSTLLHTCVSENILMSLSTRTLSPSVFSLTVNMWNGKILPRYIRRWGRMKRWITDSTSMNKQEFICLVLKL